MATTIVSLVIKIGELVWDPIKHHGSYLFCYGRNIQTFNAEVDKLVQRQNEVQQDVDEAKQRGQVICHEVEQWLTRTNNMNSRAKGVVARSENTKCWNGCCWNPVLCYGLGKEAAKQKINVRDLINDGKFDRVSRPPPPPRAESLLSNRGFELLATTEKMMNSVLNALKDDEINIIGVYGMGGVGKTTLMKEVAKQAERDKLFNKVIMVTISQTIIIQKIQKEIGEMVGFKFEDDSMSVRAAKLLARLKEEKLLVILDDLWDKLELSDVGIPCGDADKGCKIVITSRSADVCNRMIGSQGSQTKGCKIEVKPLLEEESWNLFRAKAGDVLNSNELSKIAMDIVRECKGLPLAIVVLGLTLSNKSDPSVWNAVLWRLKNSIPEGIQGMQKEVFQSIEYSYDYLESEETKLCFLFCCLFPEDEDIDLTNITWYMVGEGLIKFTETLDEARNQVSLLFDNLKNSGLLLEGDRERSVKMHDIVRDVAIWIASKEYGFYSRPKVALKEWPTDMESCRRISLQYNEISELPREPMSFPNLHTLLLNENRNLEMIPEEFFSEMKALKVLDLSWTKIRSLPSSLSSLMNLRVLLCACGFLKDLSGIGALKSLEVLDLYCAGITVLPTELGELSNLRSLNLFGTKCRIPSGVISQLTRLEELRVVNGFEEWQPEGSEDKSHAAFAELACLSRLRTLYVTIKDERCFQQDLGHNCFQELKTFQIVNAFGYHYVSDAALPIGASVVPDWAKLLAERAKELFLRPCPGVEFLDGGLDISITTAFSNIKHLYLIKVKDLCRLCQMAPPDGFLANLKYLRVIECDKLTNIFSNDLISRPHRLEYLEVSGCKQLCHVFQYDSALGGESHDPILLPHLRTLELHYLPQLTSIWEGGAPPQSLGNLRELSIEQCDSLKHVFTWGQFPSLALLEELTVFHCKQLCHMFQYDSALGGESHDPILLPHLTTLKLHYLPQLTSIWEGGAPPQSLGNLRELSIGQCDSLKHVFTWGQFPSLALLEKLGVFHCKQLCHVFQYDSALGGESHNPILLPHLTTLKLHYLPQLTSIWEGGAPPQSLGNLRELSIGQCDSLKHVFTWGQFPSLALLESLKISNCSGMVAIIMSNEANSEVQVTENNSNMLPQLKSLHLEDLQIASFDEEGVSLFDWPSLTSIRIKDCPNLKKLPLSSHGAPGLREIHGTKEWFQALEWEDKNIKSRLQSLFVSNDLEDTQDSTSTSDIV